MSVLTWSSSCGGARTSTRPTVVEQALRDVVEATDVTLSISGCTRSAPGSTGVAIVSESHIMIHTWPEHGYAAVDIFTCGEERDLTGAIEAVREHFTPERVQMMHIVARHSR